MHGEKIRARGKHSLPGHKGVLFAAEIEMGKKNGPSTIPSLSNGPKVLFFSPKVEDTQS
jgi:hypothetical protein